MKECKRCGRCCYYEKDGIQKKCKYLVVIGNCSSCRIYNARIGFKIDDGIFCSYRKDDKRKIKDCPLN